ncbi:MAG: ABC transporter ATP-binding protein [Chthoniobacterales bacterium]
MNSPNEPVVQATDLVRKFGDRAVIDHLSFEIQRGETLVIMGGSGCGKSTLLRHIIGVMKPTSGSVKIFGEEITGMNERELDKVRRRFGMLFQSGALLASLTVGENVALPLTQHTELSAAEIDEVVRQKLEIVGLTGFETLKPAEISGGMKKRVGLALDPELLFSDEPTSGLDPIMTAVVDKLTLELTRGDGVTAVVVTHDMTSAFRIATRMIMLDHGKIIAEGTPDEIRASPIATVQQFINGEPDGPRPLNLSTGDHRQLAHVRPRPLVGARGRFIAKHHEKEPLRLLRRARCHHLQRRPFRCSHDRAFRLSHASADPTFAAELRRRDRNQTALGSALRGRTGRTGYRHETSDRARARRKEEQKGRRPRHRRAG